MKLEIAKALIKHGCVKLSPQKPFTYASGLLGPIYCDNRLILSHVDFRNKIIAAFVDLIKFTSGLSHYDFIGGIATAGIPHAAILADRLNKPMVYVRPKAKEHGRKNQVEGDFKANQSVILIEDLVNQGASLEEAMLGLKIAKLNCSRCLCIVDYQMPQVKNRLKNHSLILDSLTDFDHLIQAAFELNFIDSDGKKLLMDWHNDPKEWSSKNS